MIGNFQILFLTKEMNSFEIQLSGRILKNFSSHLLFHQYFEVLKSYFSTEDEISSRNHRISACSTQFVVIALLRRKIIKNYWTCEQVIVALATKGSKCCLENHHYRTSHLPGVLLKFTPTESKVSKIMEMTRFGNVLKRNPVLTIFDVIPALQCLSLKPGVSVWQRRMWGKSRVRLLTFHADLV